jgi:hypothetical protein
MKHAGFTRALIGDGVPLLVLTALILIGSGGFAILQALSGHFLPHDVVALGMTAQELCKIQDCRIVQFMIHDRVAYGGVMIAVGILYLWLSLFPLRNKERWAWQALLYSGIAGFMSFLAYLSYGYLDTWHAVGTLLLLPVYAAGIIMTRKLAKRTRPMSLEGLGKWCLLIVAVALIASGTVILFVGMTRVFVPEDIEFIQLSPDLLGTMNERLIPVIAHDRAEFGGGLLSFGIALLLTTLYSIPDRSMHEAVLLAGCAGFITAIGVHPYVGYNNIVHLAPAIAGFVVFLAGISCIKCKNDV